MQRSQQWLKGIVLLAVALGWVSSAHGSTFVRAGLDKLVADNESIVVAEVLGAESYWNQGGTLMLTDVRLAVSEVLKGDASKKSGDELTVTLLGGTIGDLSTVIVGGANLEPQSSYVLFVNREDLPGAPAVETVRDHSQGAFELVEEQGEMKAVSQAKDHGLYPDAQGKTEVPFGPEGVGLDELKQAIQDQVKAQEVK
ncbi:MAG: hypothetical protein AAF604_11650 [Acidobacteriota bacterium]